MLWGDAHDKLIRDASGKAERRFVVGSHRLGSTVRPGAFLPSRAAARPGVSVTLVYSLVSKPFRKKHARELQKEAAAVGVRLVDAGKIPLHGKFLAWDDRDLVVTSVNWASATSDIDFPESEVGVHIRGKTIASTTLDRLSLIYPQLFEEAEQHRPASL